MTDADLIVPQAIPFADETVGELVEAAKIADTSPEDLAANGDDIQPNPVGVSDRFFIPMGKVVVSVRKLEEAAMTAAMADNLTRLAGILDDLEQAVLAEDGKTITKSGKPGGTAYLREIAKFREWIKDPAGRKPPYTIWAKGNKKLPFWAFSTLPGVTCPGAGDCLSRRDDPNARGWCYSFKAWRNVVPYFRQLQNTILIRMPDKSWIEAEARKKFKPGQVVRLYVDGDFDSLDTLRYWMHFVVRFPQNSFYGYSKSWGFFKTWHQENGGKWPENYLLNLSSGTSLERTLPPDRFKAYVRSMYELKHPETGRPVVRGTFRALGVLSEYPKPKAREVIAGRRSDKRGGTLPAWNAHRKDVLQTAKAAGISGDTAGSGVFVCPGLCAQCLPGGRHACGDRKFEKITIVIGIH